VASFDENLGWRHSVARTRDWNLKQRIWSLCVSTKFALSFQCSLKLRCYVRLDHADRTKSSRHRELIPTTDERQCLAFSSLHCFQFTTRRHSYICMSVCVCVCMPCKSFLRNLAETLTALTWFCGFAGKYFTHMANIECKLSDLTSEWTDIDEKLCRHYQLSPREILPRRSMK